MPELPEVETVVRQLRPQLEGQRVSALECYDAKLMLSDEVCHSLAGRYITRVRRWGKQIALGFAPKRASMATCWLLIHLRMTGRCIWQSPPSPPASVERLRARLLCTDGAMCFIDLRRFGTIERVQNLEDKPLTGLDPFDPAFTPERLRALINDARTPLKPWLLRQDRLLGIGNIYASEICYEAGLSPLKPAGRLRKPAIERLHSVILAVLSRAIEHCGTTFSDFQDSHGEIGRYQEYLHVYGRTGEPCPHCQTTIERITQAQRSTFYCPKCQRS